MMKKRLRKKKHVGEFAEYGRQVIVLRNRRDGFDEFIDAFVEEAINANGCYCAGGGKDDKLDVIIELGTRLEGPDARLQKVIAWLEERPDVRNWKVGQEFDLWHDDFVDLEVEAERPNQPDPN
jgi:uncharacterized protein